MGDVRMFRRNVITFLFVALLCGCALSTAQLPETSGEKHLGQGLVFERSGDWEQALREYEFAAQSDGRGNFYKANLLFQQNKFEAAEREYRKAMAVLRADPALYNNLAWLLYTRRQKLEEAEELASLAVKIAGEAHFVQYWDTLEQIRELRYERAEKAALAQAAAEAAAKTVHIETAKAVVTTPAQAASATQLKTASTAKAKTDTSTKASTAGAAGAASKRSVRPTSKKDERVVNTKNERVSEKKPQKTTDLR